MNLHLFFDVFIEDPPLGKYLRGSKDRFERERKIRSSTESYRYQSKFNITQYTLISYSYINWKSVTIRISTEKLKHSSIISLAKDIFPDATIINARSDTAEKYLYALEKTKIPDNDWVFFSPNNDHPYVSNNPHHIDQIIKDADRLYELSTGNIFSIAYSHHSENLNSIRMHQKRWGAYGDIFPKYIGQTDNTYITQLNKLLLDSIHIYKMRDLKKILSSSPQDSRLIRLEDSPSYLSAGIHILLIPKKELCAHFDGYTHLNDAIINSKVPPLIIPTGFFSGAIKIRYGFDDYKNGHLNINPTKKDFIFNSTDGTDLKIPLEQLPYFWRNRISEVKKNPSYRSPETEDIPFLKDLENPWRNEKKIFLLLKSIRRLIRYKIKSMLSR